MLAYIYKINIMKINKYIAPLLGLTTIGNVYSIDESLINVERCMMFTDNYKVCVNHYIFSGSSGHDNPIYLSKSFNYPGNSCPQYWMAGRNGCLKINTLFKDDSGDRIMQ
jgi:hypothetical protein